MMETETQSLGKRNQTSNNMETIAIIDWCYKCNTKLVDDSLGYNPPVAWCPKCNEVR